jgi:hypothetical protein
MIVFLSALGLSPDASVQQGPEPATKPIVVQGEKDAKRRMICITDPATGSIIPKKTCHSQLDWEMLNRDGNAVAGELMRQQLLMQAHPRQ